MSNLRFTEDLPVAALPGSDGQNYVRVIPVNGNLRDTTRQFPLPVSGDLLERISIRRGEIAGLAAVSVFGRNPDIDSASEEDVWDGGGYYPFALSAATKSVFSTSATDTYGVSGAWTVRLHGLDENYFPISEDVQMNGTTPVVTTQSFLRVHSMRVVEGVSGGNQGDIVTSGARIRAGEGRTKMAVYTVPAGYTGYVTKVGVCASNKVAKADVSTSLKILDPAFQSVFTALNFELDTSATSSIICDLTVPIEVPEKSDIWYRAGTDTNDATVDAIFDIILVGG